MEGKKTICVVVGTRPNFVKVTRFKAEAAGYPGLDVQIVHTGQHYDASMSGVFFDQFGLRPDVFLGVEPGNPVAQIAETMHKLGDYFAETKPDLAVVVGDVNSTLAAAVAANKSGIPLAHLESGLRSGDRSMPEEHNRMVTDDLADLHFVTEESGVENLRLEGKPEKGIHFVGNTMIDTLVACTGEIDASKVCERYGLESGNYVVATIHRPSNVDSAAGLKTVVEVLGAVAARLPVILATHPRTEASMDREGMRGIFENTPGLVMVPAQSYFDFQKLVKESRFVLTDSGGIQEETTFLQKPCLTLRPNTERPVTITRGTNTLLEFETESILAVVDDILGGCYKSGEVPALWDGRATERVVAQIARYLLP